MCVRGDLTAAASIDARSPNDEAGEPKGPPAIYTLGCGAFRRRAPVAWGSTWRSSNPRIGRRLPATDRVRRWPGLRGAGAM